MAAATSSSFLGHRHRAGDAVHALFQEGLRVVVALALTSWGRAMHTAPVSAGSVSTRMALIMALMSCSGG